MDVFNLLKVKKKFRIEPVNILIRQAYDEFMGRIIM